MENVKIVFWSMTGNTEAMANLVADGVKEAGKAASVLSVDQVSVADLASEKGFALGCPAMGAEVLEEGEMEPFVTELEGSVTGKTILLFGSYGWGDGTWMRDWVKRMEDAGATVIGGEDAICLESPDDATGLTLKALGKRLADL